MGKSEALDDVKYGDCFEVAGHFAMDLKMSNKPLDGWNVVHGLVSGQNDLTGVIFTHAWMELGKELEYRMVFDHSNDRSISMIATDYYSLGKIKPENIRRYTVVDALKLMSKHGHFGPWDEIFEEYP